MDETVRKLQKELNAGTTSLVLLAILQRAAQPLYGYSIAKQLEDAENGEPVIKPGTLYPVLRTLEGQGLLSSEVEPSVSGPPRRYYSITERGREALAAWKEAWERYRRTVDALLAGETR